MADNQKIREEIKSLTDQLEAGIHDLYASDKYTAYLSTLAKFHSYSTRNIMLIHSQMPEATNVAGFNKWKNEFDRHVLKGQKGIRILAPAPYVIKKEMEKVDPDTQVPLLGSDGKPVVEEVDVTIPAFKPVSVFDVTQTDGKPLPSLTENLTGDVQHYEAFLEALKAVSAMPIDFIAMAEDTDGHCNLDTRTISIRHGMSETQTISAVVHEMTHAELHGYNEQLDLQELLPIPDAPLEGNADISAQKPRPRRAEEVEAESVSYVVCQHYGIETGANSFGYIADWSRGRDLPELKASLDLIRKTAASMIERIDGRFAEVCRERGIDLSPAQGAATKQSEQSKTTQPVSSLENPPKQKRQYYITNRQREQAERMVEKWHARAEAFYADGNGWGMDTAGYCKTQEEADQAMETADGIRMSINNLLEGNGAWADVQVIRQAVSERDALDVQVTVKQDERNEEGAVQQETALMGEPPPTSIPSPETAAEQNLLYNEPTTSPWGEIQHCEQIIEGVFSVDTASHGGIMVDETIVTELLSSEAQAEGYYDYGFMNFEEDTQAAVVIRELLDQGIWEGPAHIADKAEYEKTINDSLQYWNPEYWADRKKRLGIASATQKPDPKAEQMVEIVELNNSPEPFSEPLPDPHIGISERDLFGYTNNDMYPLLMERALELYEQDYAVFLLHSDGTEEVAFERGDIESHDGIFGIETEEWQAACEFEEIRADARKSAEAEKEGLLYGKEDSFAIYQLRDGAETRDYRFEAFEHLKTRGLSIDKVNYNLVYSSPIADGDTLDTIYQKFNLDHPKDFTGHSLSVSDVVVLHQSGDAIAHYVDGHGFKELPDFFKETRPPEKAPSEARQQGQVQIESTRVPAQPLSAVAEFREQVGKGQQISLLGFAEALKAEQGQNGAEATPNHHVREERPSVLARLQETKETNPQASKAEKPQKSAEITPKQRVIEKRPSVLARLREMKEASLQGHEQPKTAPKHNNHLEV